ncbi:putative multi-domain containing protein [Aduncisulcus paluster]|uniref:deoxyribose-phosphate aldolase n=1 Tax=Aduncisulcus paluster TaxID=2918883 RepID=A0ABQ5JX72_9EUKA|nr:putative multi-domain containing protein [Aduncisulcus paluster]
MESVDIKIIEAAAIKVEKAIGEAPKLEHLDAGLDAFKAAYKPAEGYIPGYIDHTFLKPTGKKETITKLCEEAIEHKFASVCVNPCWVPDCLEALKGHPSKVACVIGFPLGSMTTASKAFEAEDMCKTGVDEVDMVLNIGKLLDEDIKYVYDDIKAVVDACHKYDKILKVIIECGAVTPELTAIASLVSNMAGADFVKTSTGFGYGGAKPEDVALMRCCVGHTTGVKASGGVRSIEDAKNVLKAGATRIGASAGVAIAKGLVSKSEGY